ncbi:MAG: ABC transporter permease [Pirellulales bacterium]
MKPYIGILIDSFWEAVSSKVLWALLVASTLVLAALAPFGITVERSFKLSNPELNGALKGQIFEKIAKGLNGKGTAAQNQLARRLQPKFQERVRKKAEDPKSNDDIKTREIVDEFNRLLTDRQLFSADAFQSTAKIERYKEIIEKLPDQASDDEVEELNRRLLFICFSSEIAQTRGEQLFLSYAGFKLTDVIPLTKKQIRQYFEPLVLSVLLKLGLAVFTIFIAIIVTSSIIPETFKSGSLHLMLSKPISRTWLFLSKFVGGCSFVMVNFVYIILGLYLIAGVRFDIWNNGLLYCIPLLLFVFIIFYCVSSFAGILWGNAIVCVVACMVFWGFCFAIGFVREVMHDPVESNQLISRITPIEDKLYSVTELGKLQIWNAEHSIWQPATDAWRQILTFGQLDQSVA